MPNQVIEIMRKLNLVSRTSEIGCLFKAAKWRTCHQVLHSPRPLFPHPQAELYYGMARWTRSSRVQAEFEGLLVFDGAWYLTVSLHHQAPIATEDPLTFGQSKSGSDSTFRKMGINAELQEHRKSDTWKLVLSVAGMNILTSKWVFEVKETPNSSGSTVIPNARLVSPGFQQIHGVEYSEAYAPEVKFTSIRSLLALVAHFHLQLYQMNVGIAFLNGEVDEDIYMEVPKGAGSIIRQTTVCTLVKALYGVKQAPRRWIYKIDRSFKSVGFGCST